MDEDLNIDLTNPRFKPWFDVIGLIESAMAMIDKNSGTWSALSQAKSSAEKHLGTMLLYESEAKIRQARNQRRNNGQDRNEADLP